MTTIGSLFSGIGGLDLAVESFFNAETVWHCEFDPEPSKVLAARWPGVPNLGDITQVNWATVEPVDILCGGFPCQDLSLAGRRKGLRPGTRSGLWADFRNAINALRPSVVIIENVRGLLSGCAESDSDVEPCPGCVGDGQHRPLVRALGRVLGDLAALGFDAEWGSVPASAVGAPHGRFRVFVVAYARGVRLGAWGDAASGEAAGGGASAVVGGRSGAPVALLPTPSASNANDGEQLDTWFERRERVKQTANNGNGMGMPLAIAALTLLPTPRSSAQRSSRTAMLGPSSSSMSIEQAAEVAQGILPREFESWEQVGIRPGDGINWGSYEAAVRRWEALTRPAPAPTRPDGKNGRDRLSPLLPEWMMGYPAGWVTDILARDPAIKACGNGVVPQQAYAALEQLWGRVETLGVAA